MAPSETTSAHPLGETHSLIARDLSLAYESREVIDKLSVSFPPGKITAMVGPNACGKSTLLRGLARLLRPKAGTVYLDGKSIHNMHTRDVAKILGLLPQSPVAPEGITVGDLVSRGRYPHRAWHQRWSDQDEGAVARAIEATEIADLVNRPADELSGGQKQRVWIAMALAQDTDIMLLDEPTTFLDLTHQIEILDLLWELNERERRTVVIVLHDLNQAIRYSHHLIAISDGAIAAQGSPSEIVNEGMIERVFGLRCRLMTDPVSGTPMIVPVGRQGAASLGGDEGSGPSKASEKPRAPLKEGSTRPPNRTALVRGGKDD